MYLNYIDIQEGYDIKNIYITHLKIFINLL